MRTKPAVLLLLGMLVSLDVLSMRHQTVTYDEPAHLRYGRNILNLDSARFDDSKMPFSALNALPGALAARLPEGRVSSALGGLAASRFMTVLFSLLLALCVFRWAQELYGAPGGLLAL